jgi:hypothetical protein
VRHEAGPAKRRPNGDEEEWEKHLEANPQHKDIDVVIRDAFKAARRRLQDYARQQRGQAKVRNAIPPLRKDKRLS